MPLTGIIVNYRIAYTKEVIVRIPGINHKREARRLKGKKVVWKDEKGRAYKGVISGVHGSSGAIKAKFKKGALPAKALAKPVEILD